MEDRILSSVLCLQASDMNIALLVTAHPLTSSSAESAYRFAQAALNKGHHIQQVFFYQNGIYTANALATAAAGELCLHQQWRKLATQYAIPLLVCMTAALRRGLLDASEATRYEKPAFVVSPPFQLTGLGQLMEAMITADRFVPFND